MAVSAFASATPVASVSAFAFASQFEVESESEFVTGFESVPESV